MKNTTKKVLALAMGLFLTAGAMAQFQGFPTNQYGSPRKANVKMGKAAGLLAASPKGGHVDVTMDSVAGNVVYFSFDMDDATYGYVTFFSNAGLTALAEARGFNLLTFLAALMNNQEYASYFTSHNEDASVSVRGFNPGDTMGVYVIAFASLEDTMPTASEHDFIIPRNGGGTSEGIGNADAMGLAIYPNPATDQMNVSANNIERVEIYNAMGQKVKTMTASGNTVRIIVSDLAKGAYVAKIHANGAVATQKVVVK